MGGEGVNFTILVLISGETLQGNVFQGQLRSGDEVGGSWRLLEFLLLLLRCKLLLLLLRSKLLLGSKLLLLLRNKPLLLLRSNLLLLPKLLELRLKRRSLLLELLLLPRSKLLLLLRSKLLLLLRSKLLLLLELLEILVEVLSIELFSCRPVRVELGRIKDWPSWPSTSSTLGGKGASLRSVISLLCDPGLLLYDARLVREHSSMPLLFQQKLRARGHGGACNRCGQGTRDAARRVAGEAGRVVGRVLNDDDLTGLVQVAVLALHVALLVPGLQLEGSISGLVADGVGSIIIDLVDLLEDDGGVLGGGGNIFFLCAAPGGFF